MHSEKRLAGDRPSAPCFCTCSSICENSSKFNPPCHSVSNYTKQSHVLLGKQICAANMWSDETEHVIKRNRTCQPTLLSSASACGGVSSGKPFMEDMCTSSRTVKNPLLEVLPSLASTHAYGKKQLSNYGVCNMDMLRYFSQKKEKCFLRGREYRMLGLWLPGMHNKLVEETLSVMFFYFLTSVKYLEKGW